MRVSVLYWLAYLAAQWLPPQQHIYDKLECFDGIRTRGKSNYENEFLEMVFQLLEEMIIY